MNRTKSLQRIRYWQGQLLAAGDLRAQIASDLELRRLHNRSLHQAYGVSSGFAATFDAGGVSVSCGLAYDCSGRPLVSLRTRTLPFPGLDTQAITLVILYDRNSPDEVQLAWKGPYDFKPREGVAVARAIPKAGAWVRDDAFQRIAARAITRPRLASGQTVPGDTPWQAWVDPDTGEALGVKATVDTSAAGFPGVPRYFASAVRDQPSTRFADAWFSSLADVAPDGFTLRLFLRGIERERLAIATDLAFLAKNQALDKTVQLNDASAFVAFDLLSRLTPRMREAVVIDSPSKNVLTLRSAFDNAPDWLAVGTGPRTTTVSGVAAGKGVAVEVENPDAFNVADVVVRMGANPETSTAAVVSSKEDDGTLILSAAIPGLGEGSELGVAQVEGTVKTFNPLTPTVFTVDQPDNFSVGDIVVRLGASVEASAPATILKKDTPLPGTPLTISVAIKNLGLGSQLGVAKNPTAVDLVLDEQGESKATVASVDAFRRGDLVAKRDIVPSDPARIQRINTKSNVLTLSKAIPGLGSSPDDTLVGVMFRLRATVREVTPSGARQTVKVDAPDRFPKQSFVARVDEELSASLPSSVVDNSGGVLLLNTPIDGLAPGDVLALCELPHSAKVSSFDPPSGRVDVDSSGGFKAGDIVASPTRSGISTVAGVSDATTIVLRDPIDGLTGGDDLAIVQMLRAVKNAKQQSPTKIKVDDASGIRAGDLLGAVAGWAEAAGPQFALQIAGNVVSMSDLLDGLLPSDAVGSCDLRPDRGLVRLKLMPALVAGDEVTIFGRDTITGRSLTVTARVSFIVPPFLVINFPGATAFSFRPEEIAASVPFAGAPADFATAARKEGLYVEWLGCEEQPRLPFSCDRAVPQAGGCDCGNGGKN